MYSLDVNFLKDREPVEASTLTSNKPSISPQSTVPLIAGIIIGLIFPAAVGGYWWLTQQNIAKVEKEIEKIEQQIAANEELLTKRDTLQKKVDFAQAEANAFATVFNQIKPWSSILTDLGNRIPRGVKISNIKQTEIASEAVESESEETGEIVSSLPTIQINISGFARNFSDVNDFLIDLQNSKFLTAERTFIAKAELTDNPEEVEVPENIADRVTIELPKVVSYEIQTELNQIPASDPQLSQELESTGAVGLTRRINILKQKGVL